MFIISLFCRFVRMVGTSGLVLVLIYLLFSDSSFPQCVRCALESGSSRIKLWSEASDIKNARKKLTESSEALRELKQNREALQTQLAALASQRTQIAERVTSLRRQLGESLLSDESTDSSAKTSEALDKYRRLVASIAKLDAAFDEGGRSAEALDDQIAAAEYATDDGNTRLAARELVVAAHDALARGNALLQANQEQ